MRTILHQVKSSEYTTLGNCWVCGSAPHPFNQPTVTFKGNLLLSGIHISQKDKTTAAVCDMFKLPTRRAFSRITGIRLNIRVTRTKFGFSS